MRAAFTRKRRSAADGQYGSSIGKSPHNFTSGRCCLAIKRPCYNRVLPPPPKQAIRDPFILEFLDLKDEYSESDLEEALLNHLMDFMLELGDDFAFVGRQRRLRIDDSGFRVDLLFFHRKLRCLLVIDLKVGKFSYADAGQMNMYLNYAKEHWTMPGENPPVGLILCAEKGAGEAHYSLNGLPNTVMASEYRVQLPDEKLLADELIRSQKALAARGNSLPD